jgi:hypothetical protein
MRIRTIATLMFVAACSKPLNPTLVPERVEFVSVGMTGVNVKVHIAATNPNRSDLEVRSLTGKVRFDGANDVGSTTIEHALTLPGKKTTSFEAPLALAWAKMPALMATVATERDVPYEVEGTVNLGGDLLNVTVPFKIAGVATHAQIVRAAASSFVNLPGFAPVPVP